MLIIITCRWRCWCRSKSTNFLPRPSTIAPPIPPKWTPKPRASTAGNSPSGTSCSRRLLSRPRSPSRGRWRQRSAANRASRLSEIYASLSRTPICPVNMEYTQCCTVGSAYYIRGYMTIYYKTYFNPKNRRLWTLDSYTGYTGH